VTDTVTPTMMQEGRNRVAERWRARWSEGLGSKDLLLVEACSQNAESSRSLQAELAAACPELLMIVRGCSQARLSVSQSVPSCKAVQNGALCQAVIGHKRRRSCSYQKTNCWGVIALAL